MLKSCLVLSFSLYLALFNTVWSSGHAHADHGFEPPHIHLSVTAEQVANTEFSGEDHSVHQHLILHLAYHTQSNVESPLSAVLVLAESNYFSLDLQPPTPPPAV